MIRGGLSLGALTLLTGCDFGTPDAVEKALRQVSGFNDWVQGWIFDPNRLAPTYPASMVLKPPRFNAYFDIMDVKPVDGPGWRLELSGLVGNKAPWTLEQFNTLPQQDEIIRHVCVEGWDYIGEWSGVPLRTFLERVGADTRAKYVNFKTADDYPSSIDMATALHSADLARHALCAGDIARPVRLPAAFADVDEARLQEPEMDHGDRGDEHLYAGLLGKPRFQLVCRDLTQPFVS